MSDVYSGSKKRTLSSILLLPEEIFDEILLRLPSKCVGRCSAVCKSWNSLVNTFFRSHTRYQSDNRHDAQLLLLQLYEPRKINNNKTRRYGLHRDNSPCDKYTKLTTPFVAYNKTRTYPEDKKVLDGDVDVDVDVDVIGSCKGLACLVARYNNAALIWNPCIRKVVVLPKPGVRHQNFDGVRYAFGYDSCTNC